MQEAVHCSGHPRPEKVNVTAQTDQEVLSLPLNHLFCIHFLWLLQHIATNVVALKQHKFAFAES